MKRLWLRAGMAWMVVLTCVTSVRAQDQWHMQPPPWSVQDAAEFFERAAFSEEQILQALELHETYLRSYAAVYVRFTAECVPRQRSVFSRNLAQLDPTALGEYFDELRQWRREFVDLDQRYFAGLQRLLGEDQVLIFQAEVARRQADRWGTFVYLPSSLRARLPSMIDPLELFPDLTKAQRSAIFIAMKTRDEALVRLAVEFDRTVENAVTRSAEQGIESPPKAPELFRDADDCVDRMHDAWDRCNHQIAQALTESQKTEFMIHRLNTLLEQRRMYDMATMVIFRGLIDARLVEQLPGVDAETIEYLQESERQTKRRMVHVLSKLFELEQKMRHELNLLGNPLSVRNTAVFKEMVDQASEAEEIAGTHLWDLVDRVMATGAIEASSTGPYHDVMLALRHVRNEDLLARHPQPTWMQSHDGESFDIHKESTLGLHAPSVTRLPGVPPIFNPETAASLLAITDGALQTTLKARIDELMVDEDTWLALTREILEPRRSLLEWQTAFRENYTGTADAMAAARAERDARVRTLIELEQHALDEMDQMLTTRGQRRELERVRRMRRRAIAVGSGLTSALNQFWWQTAPMVDVELLTELPGLSDDDRKLLVQLAVPHAIDHTESLEALAELHQAAEDAGARVAELYVDARARLPEAEFREWGSGWGDRPLVKEQRRLIEQRRILSRAMTMDNLAFLEACTRQLSEDGAAAVTAAFYRAAWTSIWHDPINATTPMLEALADSSTEPRLQDTIADDLSRFTTMHEQFSVAYAREAMVTQMRWDEGSFVPNAWDSVMRVLAEIRDEWNYLFRYRLHILTNS